MNKRSNSISRELPSGRTASVLGLRSLSGRRYAKIIYEGAVGYVPLDMFVGEKAEARSLLKRQGVMIISDQGWNAIVGMVDEVTEFKDEPLIEQAGWTEPYFALRDGTIFGPGSAPKAIAVFPKVAASDCMQGSLQEWRDLVAAPLTGQSLPMVAVLAALASPLVAIAGEKLNFGLELSGPPEMGKTTWLSLFASTAFKPSAIPTFHSTRSGQEDMFAEFRDMPFPVDEANLVDSSDKTFVKDFAFRMANGVPKVTRDQPDRAQYRFVFATTANEPIREALGQLNGDTSGAALQRLLPLRIDGNRSEGVFSFVPEGFASSGEFATYLSDNIELHYGTPMRRFLAELVEVRAKDPAKLTERIRSKIGRFEAKSGVAAASRGKSRATSAFGLLYAAGSFAKKKGILPKGWDCMSACLEAYHNYQACLPDQTPLSARLLTIAQRAQTLDLRDKPLPSLSDIQLARHGAFIKRGKGGRVELLLTDGVKQQFFPDWKSLKKRAEFMALNQSAKDHDGQHRQVRQGKKRERFICFVLPPGLVEQLAAED